MADEISIISSDSDGAQLRRDKKNPYHARCDGKEDDEQINEAIDHVGKLQFGYSNIPSEKWEAIFGGK